MKIVFKILLAITLLFCGPSFGSEKHQKLIDDLWANRVIKAENLKPGIQELEKYGNDLTEPQKSNLNNLKAYLALLNGDIAEALKITNAVIEQNLNYDLYARAKNIQVNALVFNGNIQRSFIEMYELLDGLDKVRSEDLKLHIMHSSVIRHLYAGIFDKAIELSRKNIALTESMKLNHYYCLALIEAGNIELELGNVEQAEAELLLGKSECAKHGSSIFPQFIDYKLAKIAFVKGDHKLAKDILTNIYKEGKNRNYRALHLEVITLLAHSLVELKEYNDVYDLAEKVFEYANENNYLYLKRDVSEVLAKYFKGIGDQENFKIYRDIFREVLIKAKAQSNHRIAEYYSAMQTRKNKKNI